MKLFCPVLKYTHQTVTVILLHCYTALQFGLIKSFIFSIISAISPLTAISELQVLKLSQARAQCSPHAGERRRKGERARERAVATMREQENSALVSLNCQLYEALFTLGHCTLGKVKP